MSDAAQQTLLILGASGDLTARLLLSGLGGLLAGGGVKDLLLVGSGRHGWDDNRWRSGWPTRLRPWTLVGRR